MEKPKPSNYFEAVIQLRNPNQEVLNCVYNAIERRKDVFIAKQIPLKNGVDIYISSQRYARTIGKILKKSFKNKGTMVESKRLFGVNRQTSRETFRGTILFRLD